MSSGFWSTVLWMVGPCRSPPIGSEGQPRGRRGGLHWPGVSNNDRWAGERSGKGRRMRGRDLGEDSSWSQRRCCTPPLGPCANVCPKARKG